MRLGRANNEIMWSWNKRLGWLRKNERKVCRVMNSADVHACLSRNSFCIWYSFHVILRLQYPCYDQSWLQITCHQQSELQPCRRVLLEKAVIPQVLKNSSPPPPYFMEPEDKLSRLQEPAICPHPEPDDSISRLSTHRCKTDFNLIPLKTSL